MTTTIHIHITTTIITALKIIFFLHKLHKVNAQESEF
jgi:hypothetical protein